MQLLQRPMSEHAMTGSATETIVIPRLSLTSLWAGQVARLCSRTSGDPRAAMLPLTAGWAYVPRGTGTFAKYEPGLTPYARSGANVF
jgi:hypothetical protein